MALNTNIQLDESKMQLVQNLEIEMMSDLYNRMTNSCQMKCIPPKYTEPDLAKGESICLDRCVAKYLEVHERLGKKLTSLTVPQDDEAIKKVLEQQQKSA